VNTPEYRKEHGIVTDESFELYRAAHDDPGCEHFMGISEVMTGSFRIGRCVPSNRNVPFGHCERRSKSQALCNVYKTNEGKITVNRNAPEAVRLFPYDFPDCDELAGVSCRPLGIGGSMLRLNLAFVGLAARSAAPIALLAAAGTLVGVCE
jgi:hypothetical protein